MHKVIREMDGSVLIHPWEAGESGSVVTSVLGFESQLYLLLIV